MIFIDEDKMFEKEYTAWRTWVNRGVVQDRLHAAGDWMVDKWRDQARKHGYRKTAANMRKQGIPIEIAMATLLPGAVVRP